MQRSLMLFLTLLLLALTVQAGEAPYPNELKYPNVIVPELTFGSYGTSQGEMIDPLGVDISPDGRIYIIDSGNGRVQVFDRAGQSLTTFGRNGSEAGEFVAAEELAVSPAGLVYVADTGNNRVQVFDADGTFLRQWGSFGTAPGEFRAPRGIEVDAGRVYVSDVDNHRIQVFDLEGELLLGFGEPGGAPGQLSTPLAVTVDEEGFIYVCDEHNNRIQKFDAAGQYVDSWGQYGSHSGLMATPSDLDYYDGKLYLADLINHRIQAFDTEGNFLFQWGRHPVEAHQGNGRLHYPMSLAAAPGGQSVVVCEPFENRCQTFTRSEIDSVQAQNVDDSAWWDKATRFHYGTGVAADVLNATLNHVMVVGEPDTHAVLIFDINNVQPRLIRRVGGFGTAPGKFKAPEGMGIDGVNSRLLVSDMGNHRIQIFNLEMGQEGDFIASFGGPGTGPLQFNKPGAMVVTQEGHFIILDVGNHRVQVLNSNLEYVTDWGSFGRLPGQLNTPTDIALSPDEQTVYVLDSYNYRIQAFNRQGTFLFTWGGPGSGVGQLVWPYGMDTDDLGNVYVSDSGGQRVHRFAANGAYIDTFGSYGSELGQFYKPKGVAHSSKHDMLYVIDFGNHRGQIVNVANGGGQFVSEWGIGVLQQQLGGNDGVSPKLLARIASSLALLGFCGLVGLVLMRRGR